MESLSALPMGVTIVSRGRSICTGPSSQSLSENDDEEDEASEEPRRLLRSLEKSLPRPRGLGSGAADSLRRGRKSGLMLVVVLGLRRE